MTVVLGVTGSIGMGKTTVAGMLRARGVPVHDADAAVHVLLGPGGAAVAPMARAFPTALRRRDGGAEDIDRSILRDIVFDDTAARRTLEDILHPLVRQESADFVAVHRGRGVPLVALDIPLLFETGGAARIDKTLCVTAAADVQAARVLARPGMTRAAFEKILSGQMPDAEKRRRADYILRTDQSLAETEADLDTILADILPPAQGALPKRPPTC